MRTVIVAMLLTAAAVSPSHAEVPLLWRDGVATPCPQCVVRPTLGWKPAPNSGRPDYESRSQTVIQSRYGTSVINGTYRSYSR
jgi:hypothetical protein